MKRFILLMIILMAWAFWELSGGFDFQPETAEEPGSVATVEAVETVSEAANPEEPATIVALENTMEGMRPETIPTPDPALEPDPDVTVVTVDELPEPAPALPGAEAEPVVDPQPERDTFEVTIVEPAAEDPALTEEPVAETPIDDIAVADDAEAVAEVTAEAEEAGSDEQAENALPELDLRTVDATRVNLRAGASTDFDIVDSLPQGTVVEVLETDGSPDDVGWVRLIVPVTGKEGWMAARFLSRE